MLFGGVKITAKILFILPIDREFFTMSVFPLGLGYIISVLKDKDYEINILDLNVKRDINELHNRLNKNKYDYIGISSIITQYNKVKNIIKVIRQYDSDVRIILGGSGPSSHPSLYLNNTSTDIVCIGECEKTIVELLDILEKKGNLNSCKGIAYKKDGDVIFTSDRGFIENLDDLPFPAYDFFDTTKNYIEDFLFKFDKNNGINIITSRGCVGRCTYCYRTCGDKIRYRSPDNIIKELRFLKNNYDVQHFHFLDDTFLSKNTDRFFKLLDLVKKEGVTWSCNSRVNYIKPNILEKMKDSGCINIAYGIESGSQKILNEMRKGVKVETAANAVNWTREAGIDYKGYFIIGMPSETAETVYETVDFCKKNLVGGELFFATPMPSTPLYDFAIKNKLISDEDTYMETIGEVRNFVINLTKMDNDTLFDLKERAEKEIQDYLIAHGVKFRIGTREDPRKSVEKLPVF